MSEPSIQQQQPKYHEGAHLHCPAWCVRTHGVATGEDDWVHIGSPLIVSGTSIARLCMTVEPHTGVVEGPYIMVGSDEFTAPEARSLGKALIELADSADWAAMAPGDMSSDLDPKTLSVCLSETDKETDRSPTSTSLGPLGRAVTSERSRCAVTEKWVKKVFGS